MAVVLPIEEELDSPSGSVNEKFEREYTRTLQVTCDSANDGPYTIQSSGQIPTIGTGYTFGNDTDTVAWLRGISYKRKGRSPDTNQYLWKVELRYSSAASDSNQPEENPLNRPVEVSGGNTKYSVYTDRDVNGDLLLNSAGTPLPPVEVELTRGVWTFVRNEEFAPIAAQLTAVNRVNSMAMWGCEPKTLKLLDCQWRKVYENQYTYYQCTYVIEYNPDGFVFEPADNGFWESDGSGGVKPIIDPVTQKPVTEPQKMDGAGAAIWDDSTPPALLGPFDMVEAVDLNALGLPDPSLLG